MKNQENTPVTELPAAETPQSEHAGRGCLKIFLILSAVFVLLFLGGSVALSAAAFSEHKVLPLAPLSRQDLKLQQKLIKRLSREVFSKRAMKESRLVLKTSELQSLFRLVDYGFSVAKLAGKYRGIEPRYFEPVFSQGHIQVIYPQDTGYRWLFGGVLRWSVSATPEFNNKIVAVKVHDCRLGGLPLPKGLFEQFLSQLLNELYSSEDYAFFCSMVKKIYMNPDGSLVVVYYPAKLLPLLMF